MAVEEIGKLGRSGVSRRRFLQHGAGLTGAVVGTGALGGFLAACGSGTGTGASSGASGGPIASGGTLKASLYAQPDTLDPAKSVLAAGFLVLTNINGTLVSMNPKGEIVAGIAQGWKQTDPKTYVFNLRKGLKFHNGEPVTPDDVKFSLERIVDPKTASPVAAVFGSLSSVETTGPTQVTIRLAEPYAPLLTVLARNGQILSKKAVETGDPGRKPVGCGPFEFVEWVQGDHITLKKFAGYFEHGVPHLDQVVISFAAPSASSIQALRSKQVNYLQKLPPNAVASVEHDPAFNFTTSSNSGFPSLLAFNLKSEPLNNQKLRQAIAWAVDRNVINQVAYFGTGEPGSEEVGSGSIWYSDNDPYKAGPDLDKAKQLLAESGVKTPLKLEYITTSSEPNFVKIGEIIRDQLKDLGIELDVQVLESSVWLERFVGGEYEMTAQFNETVVDPDQMYSLLLLSTAEYNFYHYDNPKCDALIKKARRESDLGTRKKLYAQIRELIFEEVPIMYVQYSTPAYLTNTDVLGVTARPTSELDFQTIGFEEGSS